MLHLVQPDRGVFSAEFRGLSIGVLVLMTSIAVEGMAIATILPTAAAALDGLEWYGWAFSAFMLASLVGAISGGELADRRSPAFAGQLALVDWVRAYATSLRVVWRGCQLPLEICWLWHRSSGGTSLHQRWSRPAISSKRSSTRLWMKPRARASSRNCRV
jgi:hypothetical protein